MKHIFNIFILLLLTLQVVFIAGSCTDESAALTPPEQPDLIKIRINNPKIATRTTPGYSLMPENSTIRLYIYKSGDGTLPNPHPDNLLSEETWRVLPGSTTTCLCKVDDNGNWISDITDRDIALPPSTYAFLVVSPAVRLMDATPEGSLYNLPGYMVKNGIPFTLFTSDPQWFTIGHTSGEIGEGTNGYFSMNPQPFKRLTSRITFTLKRGEKVDDMRFDNRGIELNNLPADAFRTNFFIGDQQLRPMDTDATSRLSITDISYDPEGDNGKGTYYGEVQLIPDETRRNIELRFNLIVNGNNYKAYRYTLVNQNFERGKSYNFEVTVNVGGIFITGWNSTEWETVIKN